MPTTIDQAVCLRTWDWSETSQTVVLMGRETGLIRALAKGSRREGARFSGGLEALTRGEVGVVLKPAGTLGTLTWWDLEETFAAVRRSIGAFYAGLYMADVGQRIVVEGDPHPRLFDALVRGLRSLSAPASGERASRPWSVVVRFQWAAASEAGLRPELARDVATGSEAAPGTRYHGFDPARGGLTRDPGDGAGTGGPVWRTRAATVEALRRVASDPEPLGEPTAEPVAEPAAADLERAARLLDAYLRHHLAGDLPSARALFGPARGSGAGHPRSGG